MKRALITHVAGQDVSYVAGFLAERACEVRGLRHGAPMGDERVNVGPDKDITIRGARQAGCKIIRFQGGGVHDLTKPAGPVRKQMKSDKLGSMCWAPRAELEYGHRRAYQSLRANKAGLVAA